MRSRLVTGSVFHACEEGGVFEDGDTEVEWVPVTGDETVELPNRPTVRDDVNGGEIEVWLRALNGADKSC